jgi:hypothetical protein
MNLDELKQKLVAYSEKDIVITTHAEVQAIFREIELQEVKQNILNPEKLVYVEEQKISKEGEKKFNCYFAYSKELTHRYVFTTNGKLIIVTIIKINRDWQKTIKKK